MKSNSNIDFHTSNAKIKTNLVKLDVFSMLQIVIAVYGGCIGGYFLMKMRKPKEKAQEAAGNAK